MRGRNFLDVQRHGDARFVSEAVTSSGGDSYLARGKLTIRDVTRDVALPFSLRIQGDRATARGKLAIKRLDYGVGRDEWAATTHVADEVTIEFAVTATR
jgi:polyisoprenoid-binding protein YceI